MRVGPIGPSSAKGSNRTPVFTGMVRLPSPVATAFRSAPAQKVPPSPQSTATEAAILPLEGHESFGQRLSCGPVNGVACMRPVQDDRRHRPAAFDSHGFVGHRFIVPLGRRAHLAHTPRQGKGSSPKLWPRYLQFRSGSRVHKSHDTGSKSDYTTPTRPPILREIPVTHPDSFKSRKTLTVGGKSYVTFSLPAAEKNGLTGISRLPYSLKVLLENLLRYEDGKTVKADDIRAVAQWLTKEAIRS